MEFGTLVEYIEVRLPNPHLSDKQANSFRLSLVDYVGLIVSGPSTIFTSGSVSA